MPDQPDAEDSIQPIQLTPEQVAALEANKALDALPSNLSQRYYVSAMLGMYWRHCMGTLSIIISGHSEAKRMRRGN